MAVPSRIGARLAAQIAAHIVEEVWCESMADWDEALPGVYVGPDSALVIVGAADIPEPGVTTLRLHDRLWELAVLRRAGKPPLVNGPRHLYVEPEWARILGACVAATSDTRDVLSIFEVMAVETEHQRADLCAASSIVGSVLPTVRDAPHDFVVTLLEQSDKFAVRRTG